MTLYSKPSLNEPGEFFRLFMRSARLLMRRHLPVPSREVLYCTPWLMAQKPPVKIAHALICRQYILWDSSMVRLQENDSI